MLVFETVCVRTNWMISTEFSEMYLGPCLISMIEYLSTTNATPTLCNANLIQLNIDEISKYHNFQHVNWNSDVGKGMDSIMFFHLVALKVG